MSTPNDYHAFYFINEKMCRGRAKSLMVKARRRLDLSALVRIFMVALKELFPRWSERSPFRGDFWNLDVALTDPTVCARTYAVFTTEQNALRSADTDRFFSVSEALVEDLLEIAPADRETMGETNLQFLQFMICVPCVDQSVGAGDLGAAYDWVLHSFADDFEVGPVREINVGRLANFRTDLPSWRPPGFHDLLFVWYERFFYYCRRQGAIPHVAQAVTVEILQDLYLLPNLNGQSISAIRFALDWANRYDHESAPIFARILEDVLTAGDLSSEHKRDILITFSTQCGEHTSRTPRVWATALLAQDDITLRAQDFLTVVWSVIEEPPDWDRLGDRIRATVGTYASEIHDDCPRLSERIQHLDLRSSLLEPAFYNLFRFSRAAEFVSLLQLWYGADAAHAATGPQMIICPTFGDGTAVLAPNGAAKLGAGSSHAPTFVDATNRTFGLTISIQGDHRELTLSDRPGVPDHQLGPMFADCMRTVYPFAELPGRLLDGARAMVQFPGFAHPIQALMLDAGLRCALPISTSREAPKRDREVRCAFLWAAGNDMLSTLEIDAVAMCLRTHGVQCVVGNGIEHNATDFLGRFADIDFDLVWVAGHGEIDHWRLGSAELNIGVETGLGMDELVVASPAAMERRLIVLNVCDGAATTLMGGLPKLGLGAALAAADQAVVSHLWPVDQLVACAFGLLLADRLGAGADHFEAFECALRGMRRPWNDIVNEVSGLSAGSPLADRFANNDRETNNILHWGSACFFE